MSFIKESLELAFFSDAGMNAASAVTVTFRTDDTDNTGANQAKTDDMLEPPIRSKCSEMKFWFGYVINITL